MRFRAITLAVVVEVALIAAATACPQKAHRAELDNGIEVIVVPSPGVPVVSHMVWVDAGAADDPTGKRGVAHVLEHMMFRRGSVPGENRFARKILSLGGRHNAATSNDYTVYYETLPRDRLGTVMKLDAERFRTFDVEDTLLDIERHVVIEERRGLLEDQPGALLAERMRLDLFEGHDYGLPIIGWPDDIMSITRDDLVAFYQRHYRPPGLRVIIAGDVTVAATIRLARHHYSDLDASPAIREEGASSQTELATTRQVVLDGDGVRQPRWMQAWRAPSFGRNNEDEVAASVLLTGLLGSPSGTLGHLYQDLVVERKLMHSVALTYDPSRKDEAEIFLFGRPADGVTDEMIEDAVTGSIDRFLQAGITAAELERAKAEVVTDLLFSCERSTAIGFAFGEALASGRTLNNIAAWTETLERISATAILKAGTSIFAEPSIIGTMRPSP